MEIIPETTLPDHDKRRLFRRRREIAPGVGSVANLDQLHIYPNTPENLESSDYLFGLLEDLEKLDLANQKHMQAVNAYFNSETEQKFVDMTLINKPSTDVKERVVNRYSRSVSSEYFEKLISLVTISGRLESARRRPRDAAIAFAQIDVKNDSMVDVAKKGKQALADLAQANQNLSLLVNPYQGSHDESIKAVTKPFANEMDGLQQTSAETFSSVLKMRVDLEQNLREQVSSDPQLAIQIMETAISIADTDRAELTNPEKRFVEIIATNHLDNTLHLNKTDNRSISEIAIENIRQSGDRTKLLANFIKETLSDQNADPVLQFINEQLSSDANFNLEKYLLEKYAAWPVSMANQFSEYVEEYLRGKSVDIDRISKRFFVKEWVVPSIDEFKRYIDNFTKRAFRRHKSKTSENGSSGTAVKVSEVMGNENEIYRQPEPVEIVDLNGNRDKNDIVEANTEDKNKLKNQKLTGFMVKVLEAISEDPLGRGIEATKAKIVVQNIDGETSTHRVLSAKIRKMVINASAPSGTKGSRVIFYVSNGQGNIIKIFHDHDQYTQWLNDHNDQG